MSQWSDTFANHEIHQLLTTTGTLTDQASEFTDGNVSAVEALQRLQEIRSHFLRVLANVNPEIVPVQAFTNMVPHIRNMNSEVQAFVTNKNPGHLANANKHADNFLSQIGSIPTLATPGDIEGMREAVTSFRRSVGQLIHHLENDAKAYRSEIDLHRTAAVTSIEMTQNRNSSLAAEIERLEATIQAQKARLDAAIAEFQSQFSKHQDTRQEQFSESEKARDETNRRLRDEQDAAFTKIVDDHRRQFAEICDEANQLLASTSTHYADIAAGHLDTLSVYKDKAEKLIHVIGNTGMVGGYQNTANVARNTARFWQGVTLVSFVGLIGFAISVFEATQSSNFSWSVFAGRAFVAGTFGLAAAFAARQSDRHEEAERYNRRVELELASIEPYLVGLPEEIQHQIKEELAKRLFGQPVSSRKQPKVSGTNADLIGLVRDLFSELVRKQS